MTVEIISTSERVTDEMESTREKRQMKWKAQWKDG